MTGGRRRARWLSAGIALVLIAALGVVTWAWQDLRASRPALEGEQRLAGLAQPVSVMRDEFGVVTLQARTRSDQARALGFVHAQERYFQMDLLRRSGAGELAALFGAAALPVDRARRRHQMRRRLEVALEQWDPTTRTILEAYTEGVNAGLAALAAAPFEYRLLRLQPEPWQSVDSLLVVAAMYFVLQDSDAKRKQGRTLMQQALAPEVVDWLLPAGSSWDAPVTGERFEDPSPPPAQILDLRSLEPSPGDDGTQADPYVPPPMPGSNNWALAGTLTATGHAMIANDMHLGLQVPALWFRSSLLLTDEAGAVHQRADGVTLPGLPFLVVGSNGRVAWGFTNSYGDWSDLVLLERDPEDDRRYRTPDGWESLRTVQESIVVRGAADETLEIDVSRWGPVVGELPDGTPMTVRWIAHEPAAFAPAYVALEAAADVSDALEIAGRAGIPAQNFVAGDAAGNIGWTLTGPLPTRRGEHDARDAVPSSRAPSWTGWVEEGERPRLLNPEGGRLWTANSRVVAGEWLEMIGDGGYDLGARTTQIRDRLMALERATSDDLLAIQLDDEARFLARWHAHLVALLDEEALDGHPGRAALRKQLAAWEGRASAEAVAYGLVRGWRNLMIGAMAAAVTREVRELDPSFRYRDPLAEAWAWPLLQAQPMHLLHPAQAGWRDWQLALVDRLVAEQGGNPVAGALSAPTWGEYNSGEVRHPLSQAVPWLGRWLDMPTRPLPGDADMPRVQAPGFGASQRMVISPGAEAQSLFHLPGGQSGHPLSPFYGAGHDAWARGEPTPLLPGATVYSLQLIPAGSPSGSGAAQNR
ncbi:MAG: penicillin acylase family protein [Gammaproteobacteria bacterium]|nr:penicillin acylase family protein [Gammaproteobacteria bacterium]